MVEKHGITQGEVFDALLVATMEENGAEEVLTADEGHFKVFSFIKTTNPFF